MSPKKTLNYHQKMSPFRMINYLITGFYFTNLKDNNNTNIIVLNKNTGVVFFICLLSIKTVYLTFAESLAHFLQNLSFAAIHARICNNATHLLIC